MTGLPDSPIPTGRITREAVALLAANADFVKRVDFPAGLRIHALQAAIQAESSRFAKNSDEDEAAFADRILSRARAFEAYVRGEW